MNFEPCYPVEAPLFLKVRFENELSNFIPTQIKYSDKDGTIHMLKDSLQDPDNIVIYQFNIKKSLLTEILYIENTKSQEVGIRLELKTPFQTTNAEDVFTRNMIKLFGIVIYGTFSSNEELIARDSVCTMLKQEMNDDKYDINWTEGYPYINYFFMKKKDSSPFLAVGAGLIDNYTASFYMMLSIPWEKKAIITEDIFNSFKLITPEESKMANILSNVVQNIDPDADINFIGKSLSVFHEEFGEEYYKQGQYFLDVKYQEPDVSTYNGISVSESNKSNSVIINSGNFIHDLQTIYNSFDTDSCTLLHSSSMDHFEIDMK